jgi:hypothetical protein
MCQKEGISEWLFGWWRCEMMAEDEQIDHNDFTDQSHSSGVFHLSLRRAASDSVSWNGS